MVRFLRDGNAELIILVGRIMLITIHAALHGIVPLRTELPVAVPLRLARVVCRPDGRNSTRRKVGRTMWIITRVRPPGWIQDDKLLSVSWARTVRVLLCSRRLFRNLVHCRLGGKYDLRLQPVCTSLTTTPRRQRGMTHGCRRRSMQMYRSTSAISAES